MHNLQIFDAHHQHPFLGLQFEKHLIKNKIALTIGTDILYHYGGNKIGPIGQKRFFINQYYRPKEEEIYFQTKHTFGIQVQLGLRYKISKVK